MIKTLHKPDKSYGTELLGPSPLHSEQNPPLTPPVSYSEFPPGDNGTVHRQTYERLSFPYNRLHINIDKPYLTPIQSRLFLAFIALMLLDLCITVLGFLFIPGFQEGNPFYNAFISFPGMFINTVVWIKIAVISGLLLLVLWFNTHEPPNERWHGGNIVCVMCVVTMATVLGGLLVWNLVQIV